MQIQNGGGQSQEATQAVQTLAEVAASQHEVTSLHPGNVAVEVNTDTGPQTVQLAEATLNQDGQIILTSDAANALAGGDGQHGILHGSLLALSGWHSRAFL